MAFLMQGFVALSTLLIVAAASLFGVSHASDTPSVFSKDSLTYYVQVEVGAPSLGTLLQPINASISGSFGQAVVFAFNATKSQSRTSKSLGLLRGYTVETNYISGGATRLLEVEFLDYDDGQYKGTLQYQGVVTPESTELAVVGGSGSFRGIRGYVVVTFVSSNNPFSTFLHKVTLLK
ncbi:hypothetical protein KP509_26G050000 [Ceratopteris richardii]|uniref:Dirigent protein n=1 Tax=Ceratopteris richardii TaxID=49495 RepID=A0A8T2RNK7_CERRI|nr:hypothetical protein KP509_26G050000 [Ceratopteris richardii]